MPLSRANAAPTAPIEERTEAHRGMHPVQVLYQILISAAANEISIHSTPCIALALATGCEYELGQTATEITHYVHPPKYANITSPSSITGRPGMAPTASLKLSPSLHPSTNYHTSHHNTKTSDSLPLNPQSSPFLSNFKGVTSSQYSNGYQKKSPISNQMPPKCTFPSFHPKNCPI